MPDYRVVIGLGTNLGDRVSNLREATKRLCAIAVLECTSKIYETPPLGPPQPDYLNAAVLIRWPGDPHALLDKLLAIEVALGRVRRERWGPRIIDLDILWIEGLTLESPRLTVPHPGLMDRPFALIPLLDVVPDAVDPRTGRPFEPPHDIVSPTQEKIIPKRF